MLCTNYYVIKSYVKIILVTRNYVKILLLEKSYLQIITRRQNYFKGNNFIIFL